jgi:hypothetical protein
MRSLEIFDWNEAFNDSKGKSDIRLVAGFITIMVGCFISIWAVAIKFNEGLLAGGVLVASGSGLLGIGRFTKDEAIDLGELKEETIKE